MITKIAQVCLHNEYHVECWRESGDSTYLAWTADIVNTVPDLGANDLLNKYLAGSSYTAAIYIGLVTNTGFTSFQTSDTAAKISTTANPPTTNSWAESNVYSNGTRPAFSPAAASGRAVTNSSSPAAFNINNSDTLYGCFLVTSNVIGGTSGILFGEGAFTQGTRTTVSGDTISVTVSVSVL
jgi:hypothetical protein